MTDETMNGEAITINQPVKCISIQDDMTPAEAASLALMMAIFAASGGKMHMPFILNVSGADFKKIIETSMRHLKDYQVEEPAALPEGN